MLTANPKRARLFHDKSLASEDIYEPFVRYSSGQHVMWYLNLLVYICRDDAALQQLVWVSMLRWACYVLLICFLYLSYCILLCKTLPILVCITVLMMGCRLSPCTPAGSVIYICFLLHNGAADGL
ncbi:uncharacterized protein [Spinacia oleracea]|uniref:Uncharacterized protein isoform X2 n=1 Tax=Spinacia oleracea TaxID=3562 RepID=A0A9R0ISA4_SPIOL|nr:uncharacterized protein LOC110793098 isoform X2 [Spinacia oleracea]